VTTHALQLFDTPESLADAVFVFLRDGLLAGDHVALIMTAPHWQTVRTQCFANGIDVDAALGAGWLTFRDAGEVIGAFVDRDLPNWTLFDRHVGNLIRRLSANGTRVRVYGEAVDLLARSGDFAAAARLEEFWNRLGERTPLNLLCGYSSEHFGNPRDADSLRHICSAHSQAHADRRDVLGSFLLKTHVAC
jgi:hypothetical protein